MIKNLSMHTILIVVIVAIVGWALFKHMTGAKTIIAGTASDIDKNLQGMTT